MPRREFEQVVAQAPKTAMKVVDLSPLIEAAPNVNDFTIDCFSAEGTEAQLNTIYINAVKNTSGTTGTHQFTFTTNGDVGVTYKPSYFHVASDYTKDIFVNYTFPMTFTSYYPTDFQLWADAVRGVIFDSVRSLRFRYQNTLNGTSPAQKPIVSIIYQQREVR